MRKCFGKDPDEEIANQKSSTSGPAVQKDPDAQILRQRSCTSAPEIDADADPGAEILRQRSFTIPQKDVDGDPERDLTQVVLQDPDAQILRQRPCTCGAIYSVLIQDAVARC